MHHCSTVIYIGTGGTALRGSGVRLITPRYSAVLPVSSLTYNFGVAKPMESIVEKKLRLESDFLIEQLYSRLVYL